MVSDDVVGDELPIHLCLKYPQVINTGHTDSDREFHSLAVRTMNVFPKRFERMGGYPPNDRDDHV